MNSEKPAPGDAGFFVSGAGRPDGSAAAGQWVFVFVVCFAAAAAAWVWP